MNQILCTDSVTSFSPTDPDLWQVTITGDSETWTLPVIGFATVVTQASSDGGQVWGETRLYPVLLDDDGSIVTVWEYLHDFDKPKPKWALKRKA